MYRGFARSACGITVFDTPEKADQCSKNISVKLMSAGVFALIGFIVLLILVLIMFTVPLKPPDVKESLRVSLGDNSRYGNNYSGGYGYDSDGYDRYGYNKQGFDRQGNKKMASTPTILSATGKFILLFGTIAFAVMGYMMANQNTFMSLYNEDNAAIENLLDSGNFDPVSARKKAVETLSHRRDMEYMHSYNNNRYGYNRGITLDLQ